MLIFLFFFFFVSSSSLFFCFCQNEPQCSTQCKDSEVYMVSGHSYVGGYYGAAEEINIMQELQNGPIPIALEVHAPVELTHTFFWLIIYFFIFLFCNLI
jgi:hypothetical protein